MNETSTTLSTPLGTLRLDELTGKNIHLANQLSVKPGQERFILPATFSMMETPPSPATSWERVAVRDDKVVGFIDANLDTDPKTAAEFRACIWRIFVDADAQDQGVGSFLIRSFADAAARAGIAQVTVIWEEGPQGPGDAFHRIGFTDIGQTSYGEIIGAFPTV